VDSALLGLKQINDPIVELLLRNGAQVGVDEQIAEDAVRPTATRVARPARREAPAVLIADDVVLRSDVGDVHRLDDD
jgi:hypothetical protein